MQEDVASRGRRMVTIVDPHVKRDHNYYIFSEAEKNGFYVKNKHGSDFDGWVLMARCCVSTVWRFHGRWCGWAW